MAGFHDIESLRLTLERLMCYLRGHSENVIALSPFWDEISRLRESIDSCRRPVDIARMCNVAGRRPSMNPFVA